METFLLISTGDPFLFKELFWLNIKNETLIRLRIEDEQPLLTFNKNFCLVNHERIFGVVNLIQTHTFW